ncbi:MAG: hypothetical protein HUK01_09195 [Bacteroidaceae bacterium]|nr:hypothetical protein [Bacteroidaceae bacterium]
MTDEEMESDTQRILDGQPTSTDSVNAVTDTPKEFKAFARQFQAKNEERERDGRRPLQTPYFVKDNKGYYNQGLGIKTPKPLTQEDINRQRIQALRQSVAKGLLPKGSIEGLETLPQAELDQRIAFLQQRADAHAARTPEDVQRIKDAWEADKNRKRLIRKKADGIFKVAQDFRTDIDPQTLQALEDAIKSGDLTAMNRMTKPLAHEIKGLQDRLRAIKQAEILDNPEHWHSVFSLNDLQAVQTAMEKRLADFKEWGYGDFALDTDLANLQKLKTKLENQAYFATQSKDKYRTWEVAHDSWKKLADKAQNLIEWQPIKAELAALQGFKTKSKPFADMLAKAQAAVAGGDKNLAQSLVNAARAKMASLQKKAGKTAAVNAGDLAASKPDGVTMANNTKAQGAHLSVSNAYYLNNPDLARTYVMQHTNVVETSIKAFANTKEGKAFDPADIQAILACDTPKKLAAMAQELQRKYDSGKMQALQKVLDGIDKEFTLMARAVDSFSFQWDYEIRAYQRGAEFTPRSDRGHTMEGVKERAESLERFIQASPKWNGGTTYRGMSLSQKDLDYLTQLLKNGDGDMLGAASWSTESGVSEGFAISKIGQTSEQFGDKLIYPVVLQTATHSSATSICHLSKFPHEMEVLGTAAERWKFIKMERKGEYVYIIVEPV